MSTSTDAIEAALERARQGTTFELYHTPVQTDAQRAKQLDAERAPAPEVPIGEAVGAAIEEQSYTKGLTRFSFEQLNYPQNPDYVPPAADTPEFQTMVEGLPPEYWPRLGSARSPEHVQFIKEQVLTEVDATRKLNEAGWTGTGLRIATSILDPVSLAIILATGGSSVIMQGGRAARAVRLGLAAGAENVALEAILVGTSETKDVDDLYVALIGGIVAGGAIGAVLPGAARKQLYETGKDLANGGTGSGKAATEVTIGLDENLSMGAAQTNKGARDLLTDQPSPEILDTPQLKGAEAKLRFDWYAETAKSDNPYVRHLGKLLLEDPVGSRGVVQAASAEEFSTLIKKRALTTFYRDANPALDTYLKGVPLRERGDATNRFFEDVTAAVRAEDFSDPVIGKAAQSMQTAIKNVADEAKRFGVKGFEDLDLSGGYVPRIPSAQKVDQLVQRFGNKQIEELFATAFERAAGVAPDVARRIAKGYIHNVRLRGAGATSDFHINVADKDAIAGMMRAAGVGEDEIADVTKALKGFGEGDDTKAGKIARAKRRLSLDESVTAKLKDRSGQTVDVAVTDLFENDARILTRMYVASVGGHAALARAGIRSPGEWETMLRNARLYAHDRLGSDAKAVDKEITKLEMAHKVLTGKPLLDYNDPVRALSFVARDWAYVAQSGMFGFAQASELAAVLTTGGFRIVSDSVPALKGMFTRAADGKLTDEFAREIEDFVAPGTDAILHSTVSRFEGTYDEALTPKAHGILEKTEGARHKMRKAAGYVSGLTPITIALQRLGTRYIAQRVVNSAVGNGRGFSADRLVSMGLDGKMKDRVFKQITDYAITDAGGVKRLDLERWTDPDARDAFVLAVQREGQRTVLVPTLGGSSSYVAGSEVGKVLTQFMTFALQAHSRILLHGIKHMDAERAINWTLGMALAGMAYTARTHLEASARRDREKYLRDRLAPGKIAAAAFSRSGFSALMPQVIDTGLSIAPGVDPLFSHTRTSGLGTSMTDLSAYPAGAIVRGIGNAAGAADDGRFTRTDWQNIQRLIPFGRALGVRQILDALGNDLPEK